MYNATITRRVNVTKDLFRIWVRPDLPCKEFLAGQYVALGLLAGEPRPVDFPQLRDLSPLAPDKLIKRAYSIASSPERQDELEFFVAVVPDGALTSRLVLCDKGSRVYLAPKITGSFTLKTVPPDKNLVFIATGTGIAPFMSMLTTKDIFATQRKIAVVHGVRHSPDLAYHRELLAFEDDFKDQMSYIPTVSREDASWQGKRGRVTRLLLDGELTCEPDSHVFLCGSPSMIEEMQRYLEERGFVEQTPKSVGNLHIEKYW